MWKAWCVCCALTATVAHADILFDQPVAIDFMQNINSNGFICETNHQRLADDFVLGAESDVTSFHWNGAYRRFKSEPWEVGETCQFRIQLFAFSGANPEATPLASFDLLATAAAIVGFGADDRPIYEFHADLSLAFRASAATRYAVSILENDPRTRPAEYLWSLPSPTSGSVAWVFVDGGWRAETGTTSSAYAFQVRGTPIPCVPSLTLVAALIGCYRRRPRN